MSLVYFVVGVLLGISYDSPAFNIPLETNWRLARLLVPMLPSAPHQCKQQILAAFSNRGTSPTVDHLHLRRYILRYDKKTVQEEPGDQNNALVRL